MAICVTNGLRDERIQASPQFSEGLFRNTHGVGLGLQKGSRGAVMKEFLFRRGRRKPIAPLPSVDPIELWKRPVETGLRATWLGHSTLLLEIDGFRVLTDPVWGERVSPTRFLGPKRFQPVPVPISGLPPIDAVIISHDHYDHLDYPSIMELARSAVPFYTSLGVGARLERWGIPVERIFELDWWEAEDVPDTGLRITAAPSQHFSGRSLNDRNRTLWSSFAIRGPSHGVFFSGDTGLTPEYREIAERLGPFDLVMLEVGAFHPAWGTIHLGPDNALEALDLLGGGAFLPVHWGTFDLGIHDWDEPAERLVEIAPARSAQLVMPRLGAPVEPSRFERVERWWREISALEKETALPETDEPPQLLPIGEPID